jgi:hypothetical protein
MYVARLLPLSLPGHQQEVSQSESASVSRAQQSGRFFPSVCAERFQERVIAFATGLFQDGSWGQSILDPYTTHSPGAISAY